MQLGPQYSLIQARGITASLQTRRACHSNERQSEVKALLELYYKHPSAVKSFNVFWLYKHKGQLYRKYRTAQPKTWKDMRFTY